MEVSNRSLILGSTPTSALQKCFALRSYPAPFTTSNAKTPRVSVKSPPPEFDYILENFQESRSAVAEMHPELLDLADAGRLVLIEKKRFGPVPIWRTEFVEPETIWLVGTSHISEESVVDVERVVRAVKPESVVVELCRSRAGILYTSKSLMHSRSSMFSLSGAKFLEAVSRSINLGGQTALALRLLLAVFSSRISSNANRPFGGEFRAAREASEEVGAQIVLGDRPIEITLGRAWGCLKWSEKFGLLSSLLGGIFFPSVGVSGRDLKDERAAVSPFQLYEKLSLSYPSLLQPLIHERDMYLAWSLKRSKAVNGNNKVVGVIGRGHLNGVIYALISDQGDLRFRDLTGKRDDSSRSLIDVLIRTLVRDTLIGLILWALYEQLKITFHS